MKEPINITARTVEPAAPGFTVGDLYYLLFRHKWKIALIFLGSLMAAAALYFTRTPIYRSEAKILIRYILESKSTSPGNNEAQVKSPDSGGNNIINSEIEILTSLDLAARVADLVGPEKILGPFGGGNDRMFAAALIRRDLQVDVPKYSSILRISYRHPDAAVVQNTLSALVDTYLENHLKIHQGVGVLDDFFMRQADQLRGDLKQTEEKLKKLRSDAQILSLDESKRTSMAELARISEELRAAETDLAERRATLFEFGKSQPATIGETNVAPALDPAVLEHYRQVYAEQADVTQQLVGLRARYTEEHFQVRHLSQRLAGLTATRQQLESEHPELARQAPTTPESTKPSIDLPLESIRVTGLEARVRVLSAQLDQVRTNTARIIDLEPEMMELQRKREEYETNYRYYSTSRDKAQTDATLGAGKITNISIVQTPSPAAREMANIFKPLLLILAFGFSGGLAWGFVSDRFLNQTIKHVADLERHLPVPLFLSVPDLGWRGNLRLPGPSPNGRSAPVAATGDGPTAPAVNGHGKSEVAPWDTDHKLRVYYEGLRDRLITYFEVRNMNHKPKLVAVTSCMPGAGVTTMAAGLAATLSETGDGNVLLVDMNLEQGAAHQFYQGKPARGLSEALDGGDRANACVAENFYMVTAHETNNQKLPRILPKRFANLVPKMKASDYDYIIFDMPPITQTSVTARLSGFMDMVVVVVESEKTGQEILKRAHGLLNESRATVAAVLNKQRAYVPKKLSQEL